MFLNFEEFYERIRSNIIVPHSIFTITIFVISMYLDLLAFLSVLMNQIAYDKTFQLSCRLTE